MNQTIKSGFLDTIFSKNADLQIDYDFRTPSYTGVLDTNNDQGYLFFNSQTGISYQYSGGKIYDTGNPALTYSDSSAIPLSMVSGVFNGKSKYKVLGKVADGDWTAFVIFQNSDTGDYVNSKVLFSSKTGDASLSGFAVGINGCNRVFCEHNTPSSGKRIYTLNQELDNKNLISVSKIDSTISIGLHQFDDTLNKISSDSKFDLIDYSYSDSFYLGGLGASGQAYKNFSGTIDSFMMFNVGLGFAERNTFAKSFYCSSYATGGFVNTTETFFVVTGVDFDSVAIGTGITGFQEYIAGTEKVEGGTVNRYGYSGVSGYIYDLVPIERTGTATGISQILTYNKPSGIYDYGYISSFANSKIVLLNNFDSSVKEVYSFSGRNNDDLNLIPNYSINTLKYTILPTGTGETINFYANGLAQPFVTQLSPYMSGDFTVSGNAIDTDGFFDISDFPIYDIISGTCSISGITTGDVSSGTKTLTLSYVNDRDLYLNGSKLLSGVDYYSSGASVIINTTNLIDGDLMLLPKHNQNISRYTGYNDNNFDTNIKLIDEQVWVNGLRQIKLLDYEKIADFSLKYSTFSLEPLSDIIYNNDTGFFNV